MNIYCWWDWFSQRVSVKSTQPIQNQFQVICMGLRICFAFRIISPYLTCQSLSYARPQLQTHTQTEPWHVSYIRAQAWVFNIHMMCNQYHHSSQVKCLFEFWVDMDIQSQLFSIVLTLNQMHTHTPMVNWEAGTIMFQHRCENDLPQL